MVITLETDNKEENKNEAINTETEAAVDTSATAEKPLAKKTRAQNIARFAVMLAFVIILQCFGSTMKIGATSISLVLIPIVLGGILLGPLSGTALGTVFGIITLVAGVIGADAFTLILFQQNPVLTSLLCIIKGAAAGLVPALLYKLIAKKHEYVATYVASAAAPIVNTAIFVIGALFMSDTISANFVSDGTTVIYFLIIGCAGWNFVLEFALNIVVTPAIYRIRQIVAKKKY